MRTVLLIILVLLLIGAFPAWPYSTGWGYYPSGGLGLILVIVLILILMGVIWRWSAKASDNQSCPLRLCNASKSVGAL